ncbi:hypothetical protein EDD18DRAFT_1331213 [Armillaria luteobubalina]|uniref:Uncharacterized protein n=1 Tax=Armillaria luteobubalina TaxID=153913 RepID=A0AA39Q6Q9_9AGAR|nr:hypothetical protein EDD18DRAFT_1331213 [Armillaria luteobubalina]
MRLLRWMRRGQMFEDEKANEIGYDRQPVVLQPRKMEPERWNLKDSDDNQTTGCALESSHHQHQRSSPAYSRVTFLCGNPKDQDTCKNAVKQCLLLAGQGPWLYGHTFPPVYLLNREANHPIGVRRNNAMYRISDMATERPSDTYGIPSSGRASEDDESGTSTSSDSVGVTRLKNDIQ